MPTDVAALRRQYTLATLDERDAPDDPLTLFGQWFDEALAAEVDDPNAMTLSTVTSEGLPAARIVLLKGFDERGFTFYTNRQSQKGHDLAAVPHAALTFWWGALQRQVRLAGPCTLVSDEESDAYFASRPRGSRLGAWTSPQSQPIADREALETQLREVQQRFGEEGAVPRPPHWGGYRVAPQTAEFWQGRASRLHDRLRYRLAGDTRAQAGWLLERLAP